VLVRRYEQRDRPTVWALNHIPFEGMTADPLYPLDLPPVDGPAHFDDLRDVVVSFIEAGGEFLVVEMDGRVVGMGGIRPNEAGQAEVLRVRVHPATRRRGVGRLLMESLERRAAELGFLELHLDTTEEQPEAIAFYRSLGYRDAGTAKMPNWTLLFFTKPCPRS